MENYFDVFKIKTEQNYKMTRIFFFIVSMAMFGSFALYIADLALNLALKKSLSDSVTGEPGMIAIMVIELPLSVLCLVLSFYFKKREKEDARWKRITVYIKMDGEYIPLRTRCFTENPICHFDTQNNLVFSLTDVINEEQDGFVKMVFPSDGNTYYILLKKEDYETLFMNRGV